MLNKCFKMAAPWRKQLDARLPQLVSRVRASIPPWWVSWWTKGTLGRFFSGFSRFLLPQISFNHFSTITSFISFHFISSVMVRKAWSAGILAIRRPTLKGLHPILSLDQALYRKRLEDIHRL